MRRDTDVLNRSGVTSAGDSLNCSAVDRLLSCGGRIRLTDQPGGFRQERPHRAVLRLQQLPQRHRQLGARRALGDEADSERGELGRRVAHRARGQVLEPELREEVRGVGVQGLSVAEGAYQHALAFALERKQGRGPVEGGNGTIVDHADVRRMLTTMKADIFASRAIALSCAVAIDMANATGDAGWEARAALLTPINKAFGTDTGIRVSELGVQVHGGMGFIEETGAAQYSRDVRVTAIYEGTNGIQAMDLVGRKMMDDGAAAYSTIDEIEAAVAKSSQSGMAVSVGEAAKALRATTETIVAAEMNDRFAGAMPYLTGFARVLGGYFHLLAADAEGGDGPRTKLAKFYIDRMLPEHVGLFEHAIQGADDLYAFSLDDLAG